MKGGKWEHSWVIQQVTNMPCGMVLGCIQVEVKIKKFGFQRKF